MSRHIDDIVETLRDAKKRNVSTVLLVGAGCSVSAGIPTAEGFVKLIRERYPRSYERAQEKQYPQCMAELSVAERRNLIVEHIEKAKVNWAHVGIAQLMLNQYIDRVLTTNFDPLIMQACGFVGIYPAIYDFAASQYYKPADIPNRSVFHLHGQHTGFVLLHTQDECTRHASHLAPVFQDAGRSRVWIVIGYSGQNDPVFEHLASVDRFDNRLYWIGYKDKDPPQHVHERLLIQNKDAHYVKGFDADEFFVALAQKLGCFPPTFIARPFSHLAERFDRLAPFRPANQEGSPDVVSIARQVIRQAVRHFETPQLGSDDADSNVVAAPDAPTVFKAMGHLIAGQFDEALAMRPRKGQPFPKALRSILANAHWAKGNSFLGAAQTQPPGDEKESKLSEAIEQYRKALEVQEHFWPAYHGWGRALAHRACERMGRRGTADLDNAIEKFKDALAHQGDVPTVTQDIVNSFINFMNRDAENAEALLDRADSHLARALESNPESLTLQALHAGLRMERGRRRDGSEGEVLLKTAHDEYYSLANSSSDMATMWHNAGNALGYLAHRKTGEEADQLFEQALECFRKTPLAAPQTAIRLNGIGWVYHLWGQQSQGELRTQRLALAAQHYESALDAAPEFVAALGNLLTTQRLRAADLGAERAVASLQDMLRRIDLAAEKVKDERSIALVRADTLAELTRWLPQPERAVPREQAISLYKRVAEQDRERPLVAAAIAQLLLQQAADFIGQQRNETRMEAVTWFAREAKLRQLEPAVAQSYAQTLHSLANGKETKEREKLLVQAAELLRPLTQGDAQPESLRLRASVLFELSPLRATKNKLSLLREAEQHLAVASERHPDRQRILVEWSMNLARQSEFLLRDASRMCLDTALEKAHQALSISPSDPFLHMLLGTTLLLREDAGRDENSERRLRDAIQHFEQAPQKAILTLQGWAQALLKLAELDHGPNELMLLQEATRHLQSAALLASDNEVVARNLGLVLRRCGELSPDAAALPLFLEAEQHYARAMELDAQNSAALLGRATTLAQLALLQDDDEALRSWQLAEQLFESAERAHPHDLEVFLVYGNALLERAEVFLKDDLWKSAEKVFRRAAEQAARAGQKLAWPHVGIAATLERRAIHVVDEKELFRLANAARDELFNAEDRQPNSADAAIIFSGITLLLLNSLSATQQVELLTVACSWCEKADSSTRQSFRLYSFWGQLLMELAARAEGEACEPFFKAAIEKLELAFRFSADHQPALFNQAGAWMTWAQAGSPHHAAERLEHTELILKQAANIASSPLITCGLIELKTLRALLSDSGIDEALLVDAETDLTRILEEEAQNALVHYFAGRIRFICAKRLPEPRAIAQKNQATKHLERAEQLSPGIMRSRLRFQMLRPGKSVRLEEAPSLTAESAAAAAISGKQMQLTSPPEAPGSDSTEA